MWERKIHWLPPLQAPIGDLTSNMSVWPKRNWTRHLLMYGTTYIPTNWGTVARLKCKLLLLTLNHSIILIFSGGQFSLRIALLLVHILLSFLYNTLIELSKFQLEAFSIPIFFFLCSFMKLLKALFF